MVDLALDQIAMNSFPKIFAKSVNVDFSVCATYFIITISRPNS